MGLPRRRWLQGLAACAACGLAPYPARAGSMALPAGQAVLRMPFELIDNRIFIPAQAGAETGLRFVFDSGGANILNLPLAQRLDLALRGRFEMPGAGSGTEPAWRTTLAQAAFGAAQALTMRDAGFVVFSLEALRRAIGFARLDGLVGHELLRRFVVRLDFANQTLVIGEPGQQVGTPADAVALPLKFNGNLPLVDGQIDGRAAKIVIDCGDRSSLTLFTPFVDAAQLRAAYPRRFSALTGFGVGGPLMADVTQVRDLALGPVHLQRVTARMPTARAGAFASTWAQASIGTGALKRLDVTFDYGNARLWLAPRADAAADPVDHSGLWLAQGEGDFVLRHVSADGPAADAGLREGERLIAVDGVATSALALPALRTRWAEAAPGTRVHLRVAAAGPGPQRELWLVLRQRWPKLAQGRG
jgi:hypothetical protein